MNAERPARVSPTVIADAAGKFAGLVLVIAVVVAFAMCAAWLLLQLGDVLFGAA